MTPSGVEKLSKNKRIELFLPEDHPILSYPKGKPLKRVEQILGNYHFLWLESPQKIEHVKSLNRSLTCFTRKSLALLSVLSLPYISDQYEPSIDFHLSNLPFLDITLNV